MDTPLNVPNYVELSTEVPLKKDQIRKWCEILKEYLPDGILTSIQTTTDKGELKNVCFLHRETKDKKHLYVTPIARNLFDYEAEAAIQKFSDSFPDLDFEVSISNILLNDDKKDISIPDQKFVEICTDWAKARHENWMKDRIKNGWSYATTIDTKNKKHPLLRQWSDLPEKFKKIDTTEPQKLIDLLSDNGYAIIPKTELLDLLNRNKSWL